MPLKFFRALWHQVAESETHLYCMSLELFASVLSGADFVAVNTLTDRPRAIFGNEPEVYKSLSESTFRRVLKTHLMQYKQPRCQTDYCQHCHNLERKVLPDLQKAVRQHCSVLETCLPGYFTLWKAYTSDIGIKFEEQPGLYVAELVHFIHRHSLASPCARHRNSGFPCGLLRLRQRGSGLAQGKRVELHEYEAAAEHELNCYLKLLRGYLHHRNAKDRQHEALSSLLEAPPLGCAVLLSDWKELETLPLCWQATGDQFFAQARHELSVFGALLVEHADESTAEKPVLVQSWMVVVSTVLDHTSLRTAQLISLALDRKKSSRPWTRLCLLSDCGPHYRSMETICHALVTLHQKFGYIDTEVHFGCEKHFKSAADRLFGWCRQILLRCRDRKIDILDVNPFVRALQKGFQENKATCLLHSQNFGCMFTMSFSVSIHPFPTPSNPFLSIVIEANNPAAPDVQVWRDESPVPSSSKMLVVKDLKISRTYCLCATKSRLRSEPRIWNYVFSDKPGRSEVTYEVAPTTFPSAWRHGFWSKGSAAWSSRPMPLKPSEETGLSRRYLSQKEYMPDPLERKRQLLPDFDEAERKHAKSLARAREMCAQRKLVLQAKRQSQSSSSDSSSSSSTEDEEEAA